MRSLLDFLVRIRFFLFLVLLEAVCMALISRHRELRDNVAFTTAGRVGGFVSTLSSSVTAYVGLKEENRRLAGEVAELRGELYILRDCLSLSELPSGGDSIFVARVINNSINRKQNYITIDKGSDDGLQEGMGVYDSRGVVGIVYRMSAGYALVVPLVNTNSNVSCSIKGRGSLGFLRWNGSDVYSASLTELPSRSGISVGDTVVTSGYSKAFPKDLPVGYVTSVGKAEDGSPLVIVGLSVDFSNLGYVYVGKGSLSDDIPEITE